MICFRGGWVFHKSSSLARPCPLAGGKGTPYNDLYEEAPTQGVSFHLLKYMNGEEICLFGRKKRLKRANRCILRLSKSREKFLVL